MSEVAVDDIWLGFIMSIIAAISSFLGAMTSLYFRSVNQRTLSIILGFAAGIMIYTAFMKLMPDATKILSTQYNYQETKMITSLCFFIGIILLHPLEYLVNLWKGSKKQHKKGDESQQHYRRVAILVLMAITAHSFVEGLATFLSVLSSPLIAIPLVLSIIVHNFPEGMTIGALFNMVGETIGRKKAVFYSLIASLFEPIGAITAYIFILKYSTPQLAGMLKALLSGLLVATALNELIPNSQFKSTRRVSVQSIIVGMFIMGGVLLFY